MNQAELIEEAVNTIHRKTGYGTVHSKTVNRSARARVRKAIEKAFEKHKEMNR